MRKGEGGSVLVESLVALLLTTGLLLLMAGILGHVQRSARLIAHRTEGVEAARLTRDLLSLALSADTGARVGEEGLEARTFVATGERCGEGGWWFRGRRRPDPARDSLWAVTAAGRIRTGALVRLTSGECPPRSGLVATGLEADPPLPPGTVLVRVFESGRYRVDDALRYGRAGSGAQPLSAAVLDPSRSGVISSGGGIGVSVVPRDRPGGYRGEWRR